MELEEKIEILEQAAIDLGGQLRSDYSGRGMFGEKCYGLVCEDPIRCVEYVAEQGITGARHDQMGLRYIVYWPGIARNQE